MEESVFDVLDDLEYETNRQINVDYSHLQQSEYPAGPSEVFGRPGFNDVAYNGNQWPQEWEMEKHNPIPLDEFGMIHLSIIHHDPYLYSLN